MEEGAPTTRIGLKWQSYAAIAAVMLTALGIVTWFGYRPVDMIAEARKEAAYGEQLRLAVEANTNAVHELALRLDKLASAIEVMTGRAMETHAEFRERLAVLEAQCGIDPKVFPRRAP